MIRLFVIDDHPAITGGLRAAADRSGDIEVVGSSMTLSAAISTMDGLEVDVVVCDIVLPDGRALELPRHLRNGPPVVFLTSFGLPAYVAAAADAGAAGFVLKSAPEDEILGAVRTVAGGGTYFRAGDLRAARGAPRRPSDRELQVIGGLAAGDSNDEIAGRLGINARTVESHLRRMFGRYGVVSRTELAMMAARVGWIDP